MYAVTATVERNGGSKQVPTFYLDERVQGIISEDHARKIAYDVLTAANGPAPLHITAVKV